MIFQWKWVYHKCVKKTRQNDWRCFLGTRRKIAARILCAFQGSGRQFFTLDIVSYFPPWSNCFSAKVCLKKWMIMTPFACHWHFDCAAENLLCALLIFGSCAETKIFVIVKKNASLWRGCAHKKPAPCQMTWCRAFLRWEKRWSEPCFICCEAVSSDHRQAPTPKLLSYSCFSTTNSGNRS